MTNSIAQKFNVFTLLKFAFPTMVMMVFMSLYTIVDGIFVSRFVGSNALSAVNIVYPVLNLLFACGIMLSTGGSAIVARQIGEKREQEARDCREIGSPKQRDCREIGSPKQRQV